MTLSIEMVFGTAIHNTIQHWLNLLYNETSIKSKTFDMHEMLKQEMFNLAKELLITDTKKLTTKDELIEYYNDGCSILDEVRKYAKDWFPKTYQLMGIELPLKKKFNNKLQFKAFLDVVLYHKSTKTLYIYDFKTSRWGWSYQKKDTKKTDQLLLYKKYYSELYNILPDNIIVKFIILKRKINDNSEYAVKRIIGFEPSHGKISMKKAADRFDAFINTAFDDNGQPKLENIKANPVRIKL